MRSQMLTVAITATMLTLMLACSADPTPRPTETPPDRTSAQMEQLQRQIEQLMAERDETPQQPAATPVPEATARPTAERSTTTPTPKIHASTTTTTTTPQPTPVPTLYPPPTHSPSENICMRSPNVQERILARLKISSCRLTTIEELFRIDEGMEFHISKSLQQEDLAGLVNLETLTIKIEMPEGEKSTIPAHAFHGMKNLRSIRIYAGSGVIETGALAGLPRLQELYIESNHALTINPNVADELPALTKLETYLGNGSHIRDNALANFPKLESMKLRSRPDGEGNNIRGTMGQLGYLPRLKYLEIGGSTSYASIRPDTFANLPALESMYISSRTITLNEDTFKNNPRLKSISISGKVHGLRTALSGLERLETLSISTDGEKPEVILSPKSPLMRDIINQEQSPNGYTVIPPGGE